MSDSEEVTMLKQEVERLRGRYDKLMAEYITATGGLHSKNLEGRKVNPANPFSHINLSPNDVEFVLYHLQRKLKNQQMAINNGVAIYELVMRGVTRKGVKWVNSHVEHQENCSICVRDRALPWLIGKGVDIGCGMEKIKEEDCIGIDSKHDYTDRTDEDDIRDAKDLTGYEDGQFDWVYSSNTLEHIVEWERALDEWIRVLRPGGAIFLYLPWAQVCPAKCYTQNPGHVWNPTPNIIKRELEKRGVEVLECDEDADPWGCTVTIGRKK